MTKASAFDPFAHASRAAAFDKTGLGIGFTVVRQLTESHGGHIVAQSAGVGFGSRFVVPLPVMADDA